MKQFVVVALLVGLLTLALASTALAAGPVNAPAAPGGPGAGIHAGVTPGTGAGAGAAMRRGAPAWAGQPDAVEDLLGMTDAEIRAERQAGKSLVQIAQSKGVSEAALSEAILSAKKATLDGLVAEGKLTQTQADAVYAHMQTQVSAMINRTAVGPAATRGEGMQQTLGLRSGAGLGPRWSR